jgi:hypothetical protein
MTAKKAKKESFDYESIRTFEDACRHLNVDPNALPDVSNLPEEVRKPIVAHYKLIIIFKAINNGWTPDWSDDDQYKYFPWFWVLSSGFGFSYSDYYCTDTAAGVGSRLCTDSREKAMYIAKQFEAEYRDFLLYSE